MKLVVLRDASEELAAAAAWYEGEPPRPGADLLLEVGRALKLLATRPTTWPFAARNAQVRRIPLGRFPYCIYYVVQVDHVRVLAFAHTRRRPGYWRARLVR